MRYDVYAADATADAYADDANAADADAYANDDNEEEEEEHGSSQ